MPPTSLSRRCKSALAALLALAFLAGIARADPHLAAIFQDYMILQRQKPAPVWGWADPGAKVDVTFAGQDKQAVADAKGYWKITLDPLEASNDGRPLEMKSGSATQTCKDVLVGEVWIIAGQSNMNVGGPDVDTGVYPHYNPTPKKPGEKTKPEIRTIRFGSGVSLEPMPDETFGYRTPEGGHWHVMRENPPPASMVISEYAARVIRDGLDVPVGLIRIAVSGTNQVAWMSKATLEKFPGHGGKDNYYQDFLAEQEAKLAKGNGPAKTWDDVMKAEQNNKTRAGVRDSLETADFPSVLYNTRVYPLAPLAIRGVMWHQGEAGPGGPYGARLVAMIQQWRQLFGQDFFFLWGTLGRNTSQPPPLAPIRSSFYRSSNNIQIRKAMTLFGPDQKAALVEFYDTGDNGTHWREKDESGRRMGLAALTEAYGQKHIYTGPRIADSKIDGDKATITFTHVGDGLAFQPSINDISGVYLRGKDGAVRWANVKVTGKDTIEVSHPDIKQIVMIAYGDNPNPNETLFNSAGLPASPFIINPMEVRDPQSDLRLLSEVSRAAGQKVVWNIAHVRRDGYVFTVTGGTVVKAFIPDEWKGYEVESGGQAIATKESTQNGAKFVEFQAPPGDKWIIVAEKGKAAEFRKVNRL